MPVADAGSIDETGVPSFVPAEYRGQIAMSAAAWHVRPSLLAAMLQTESSWNPNAVSGTGARGLAQFEPETAIRYGVDTANPSSSIDGMAHYLSDLEHDFNGNESLAVAAYNAGPGAIVDGKIPDNGQTPGYVQKVFSLAGGSGTSSGSPAVNAVGGVSGSQASIGHLLGTIASAGFWTRIGKGAIGLGVLALAVWFLFPNLSDGIVKQGAKMAVV